LHWLASSYESSSAALSLLHKFLRFSWVLDGMSRDAPEVADRTEMPYHCLALADSSDLIDILSGPLV
jgi:hypothetical protein